ncbi:hypothetical protein BJV78DRAFT_1223704 [Lactifluus subvellereus]|nr:hypothetical protein BJV78DRAFT_1223704 [Lactifluus subvellereus]
MAALEGYAVAIEVFGILQSGLDQEHSGELSCHLWHFAAGRPDSAKQPRWCFSSTLRNLTWENLPAELKERDINCSMILVRPTPKFEELFFEISDTPITPWFPICKGHTILLSGFSPSLQPGAAALSTIPAKRPAATPAEHGSRGPKFSPQTTIVLEQPALEPSPPIPPIPPPLQELSSTSLTVTPAKVFSSSPPPPAYTPQDPGIIGQQLTADPDPAAIQENHSHTFEPSTLQQAPTLLDLIPSFSIPQPQSPLLNWDAARLLRADLVGIRAKPRKIVAAQAGRGEVNEYPLRCGRQMVEYETGVPMGNGAIAAAQTRQTRHLSHLAPKKNSDSAARLPAQVLAAIPNTVSPRRHINANKVDTGPGFAASRRRTTLAICPRLTHWNRDSA